ncbi:MAG: IPT/TIG domain-containing protein, partial [Gemmatimonadales bacterium]
MALALAALMLGAGAATASAAPPTVTSISPSSGPTAGGTPVTIKGTGFLAGAKVKIGSEATAVNVVSETEITATTAATAAGSDEVVVEDANGKSTSAVKYTYLPPPT